MTMTRRLLMREHRIPVAWSPEKVANGSFEVNTDGWNAGNASLASVAGGQAGYCLRITNMGAFTGGASQKISIPNGNYTLSLWHKNGSSAGYVSTSTTMGGFDGSVNATLNEGAWTVHTFSLTVTGDFWVNVFNNAPIDGQYTYFDEISIQVTP